MSFTKSLLKVFSNKLIWRYGRWMKCRWIADRPTVAFRLLFGWRRWRRFSAKSNRIPSCQKATAVRFFSAIFFPPAYLRLGCNLWEDGVEKRHREVLCDFTNSTYTVKNRRCKRSQCEWWEGSVWNFTPPRNLPTRAYTGWRCSED